MADNLKAVAYAAGLTPEQKRQIDILSKKVSKDKELSSLPNDIAQKSFERMPVDQQEDMVKTFGETDVTEKPKTGWRSAAFKYNPLTLAFKGFIEVADATTRGPTALLLFHYHKVKLALLGIKQTIKAIRFTTKAVLKRLKVSMVKMQ
jgi:hypothetical protein